MTSQIQINGIAITIVDDDIIINYSKRQRYNVIVNGKKMEDKKP